MSNCGPGLAMGFNLVEHWQKMSLREVGFNDWVGIRKLDEVCGKMKLKDMYILPHNLFETYTYFFLTCMSLEILKSPA